MRTKMMLFFCLTTMAVSAGNYEVSSPNGKVKVTVNTDAAVRWSVDYDGRQVLLPSTIDIRLVQGKKTIGLGTVGKVARLSVNSSFKNPFYKRLNVSDAYGQLLLYTTQKFTIEVRAYNDGAAYRLISKEKKLSLVTDETVEFCFADDYPAFIPYVNDNRGGERYCYENYPGMFLKKGSQHALKAEFAPYPLAQEVGGFDQLNLVPTKRADFIAKLNGEQALPWRAVVITERDADILNSDMAQRLAPACRITDLSWIQPGKVAWDWWNNCNVTGVAFKSGMNTDTYLYYIDFAAQNKIEYIIIDEGWSGKESLMEDLSPDIDLPRLIAYGREKGVGIILWSSWRNLIGNDPDKGTAITETVMKHYAEMGIKGFKVDFFDRDDQQVIASAYQLAACAARHHLYLDFHGLKPFGIQRAYPNIFNFEGVKGLENSKWEPRVGDGPLHNQPRYDVTAPYLRMLAGPMDYTPGAMMNAMKDNFFGNNDHPMSQGTRVHQMAMYTTFEAPLQMLADSPTKYMQNQECTDFIVQIPTTFDETVALDGQLGEYTVIARRKGTTWYVAAMTDWTPRDLAIDLSFLGEGQFAADIFADGMNAQKDATDYKRTKLSVSGRDQLQAHLRSGGGWTGIFRKQ